MKPDPYQEAPHYRYPSGGSVSSVDYDTRHGSSVSSMENHTTLNSNSNGTGLKKQPSFGYSHLSNQQQPQSHSSLGMSTLSTPQSSPQSTRVDYQQHGRGHSSYQYSSGSEDDHDSFSSREPELLGELSRPSSSYRVRRDSGLPPIKMNAAKRLPHFNTSLTSMATDSVVEEEEEEEEEGDEEDEARHPMNRHLHHEVDESSIPEEDEDDQEDEAMQALNRDMAAKQTNNLFRKDENSGSKQRTTPTASAATTQVSTSFPSPTSSSTSIPAHGNGSQYSGSNSSLPRPVEPDRGPADLSNPSAALAEALSAARATAEARVKAQQQAQQQAALDALLVGHNRVHSQSADAGYQEDTSKRNSQTSGDSNGNLSQVRIPVPDLSPTMQGYTGHLGIHQDSGRNPDGHLYPRQTSFTLSPTSSNPELTGSQSDSHSGSYGTQRPSTHNDASNTNGRSVQPSTTNYGHPTNRPVGPSTSSNMSRFSDDYNAQPQYSRHREPSLLGTSYDSSQSIQHHGREGGFSRFAFTGQDTDRGSLHSQGYMDEYHTSAVYPQGLSRESFDFQQDYTNQRHVDFPDDSDSHITNDKHGREANSSFHKQHHNNHRASAQSGQSASAASVSLYPQTASSHSLALSEDLKDQISTEAEYIMNRNTELLRILSIRDDEVQTLQQELDHTLKVMHEYEDDLMAMHTAAAKPYETYRQTLDEIGHGMTQQDALVQGYQQENEKLTSQLKSSVEIRQEAEKRHLQTVDRLKSEVSSLRSELESSDQEKYGATDLRFVLKQSQENHERAQTTFKDKEEEYLAEINELKERLKVTEQVLDEERKSKVEGMQKLERDLQDFRSGYDGMLAQLQAVDSSDLRPHPKRGSTASSADEGQADTTVDDELERDIGLIKASLLNGQTKFVTNTKSLSPSHTHNMDKLSQFKDPKPKPLDRKLTSTETLTSGDMPAHADGEKLDLEQRLSRFEADVRQSLLRSSSMDSFSSVRSSGGTTIPMATQIKPLQHLHHQQHANSRDDLRLSAMSEEHRLANKLRDRINSLNIENKRLHQELASLSQVLRVQQTERQRKVAHLEELLDMHESQANQRLDDANTEEGQARIRKVIQGLLVRIRTKEAEAEFYHNAYLDKVMELDQMALANGKSLLLESPVELGHSQNALGETTASTPSPTASVIEALETRIRELERINMETAFHLVAEQRRVQATETENGTLIREKLMLARMLEDQVEQLQSKLSLAEIAKARLQDENNELRQQQQQQQQQQQSLKDARGASSTPSGDRSGNNLSGQQQENRTETMTAMRTRMLSLTRQRDQLRDQLQEAFDIQLTLQERSGPNSGGGSAEWSMEEFKRLERSLEEKSIELNIWKERAVALEKVVERIRMIKDRPEPTGLSLDRSLTMDSESMSTSSIGGSHDGVQHHAGRRASHHTLEELDQVVLRLEQRLERRDQELQEVVQEARRQTDRRLEAWKAKWVQVVQRKNAEIHRFQVELESLMAAVDRDRSRMATTATKK
ncbi:hypothetical protein BGZ96_000555 [Linnemannia gamsii]|uniref:Up-regulated during septation protein 1 domain-containing protein n=1 Tax=Linnemannia gamsii TaxID=64522 RepID=A0ABQ7JP05_9FUNG|nr:hypothetical protein BGZ96_000555 [Linnemannia gamsii]